MSEPSEIELAIAHWKWLEPVLFQSYRVGYIQNCGEMDWNEDVIKKSFNVIKPFLRILYVDGIVHGFKHGVESKR